jgi:hypothetical protein
MARTYGDTHKDWLLAKLPVAYLEPRVPLFSVAHQLLPFVRETVQPLPLPVETNIIENLELAYQIMAKVEIALHEYVVSRLKSEYGDDEKEWWVKHVSEAIRGECGRRRGVDPKRLHDCRYLYLVEVGNIVEKNWQLFEEDLAVVAGDEKFSKNLWTHMVRRLNTLRNEVMHPLRGQSWDEDDFQFVRRCSECLDALDTSFRPNN